MDTTEVQYTWSGFSLADALQGNLVGFEQYDGGTELPNDLSETGTLYGPGPFYYVDIDGRRLTVDESGRVTGSTRELDGRVGQTLQMLTTVTLAPWGQTMPMEREPGGQTMAFNDMSTMTLRDEFAVQALKVFMDKIERPEAVDEATIMSLAKSAYRWANAMTYVASDQRDGQPIGHQGPWSYFPTTPTEKGITNITQKLNDVVTAIGQSGGGGGTSWPDNPNTDEPAGSQENGPMYVALSDGDNLDPKILGDSNPIKIEASLYPRAAQGDYAFEVDLQNTLPGSSMSNKNHVDLFNMPGDGASHPLYIQGLMPSKSDLDSLAAGGVDSYVSFNSNGQAKYTTKSSLSSWITNLIVDLVSGNNFYITINGTRYYLQSDIT